MDGFSVESELLKRLRREFERRFGDSDGVLCSRAPGRVNLIGEHTDYNGGFVMPMAVDRQVVLLFRRARTGRVRAWSQNYAEWDEFDVDAIDRAPGQSWANYVRGVAAALQQAGHAVRPLEALIHGDVPIGAGLSSSAAIEVATALAFCTVSDVDADRKELALLCQRAENGFVGVNCGIMDQFVCLHAERQRAVLVDCRSLDYELLPLDTSQLTVVVCNTMVHHELGSSAYNERRASCERAATTLGQRIGGIEQLRDVSPQMLEQHREALDAVTYRRARHVVSENERVQAATRCLKSGDYVSFGQLMNASHDSLRDDYEVSCPELDLMVRLARARPGTLGARMTGAGFGGCTVNLVRNDAVRDFREAVGAAYAEATGIQPEIYQFSAVAGASVGGR